MAATLRVCLIILLCAALQYNPLASQQSDSAWTLLNTLDVQGNISTISPDSQYVNVITEAEIAQLVRIETGEVIAENAGGSIFLFSPSGRYASYFDYGFVEMETTLLDLQTEISRAVDGYIDRYIDNERYVAVTYRTVDLKDLNSLIDLQTGEIVAEFEGSTTFSSNGRFAAVTDLESRPHIPTKIIEIATGNVIAEFNSITSRLKECGAPIRAFMPIAVISLFSISLKKSTSSTQQHGRCSTACKAYTESASAGMDATPYH